MFAFDWLLDGANVPSSAVELPAGGNPSGPLINPPGCTDPRNQFMCSFGGASAVGSQGSNDNGVHWLWEFSSPVPDGTYDLGRFTLTAAVFADIATHSVSIGHCFIAGFDENFPCSSNSVGSIPEPTTAALLGLGLLGLAIGGGRRH